MSKQASGKAYEKRLARILGGQHIQRPNFGVSAPDVEHEYLVIECKLREKLALESWMKQVEEHHQPGKVSVVVCKQKRLHDCESIVCMRISDFLKILDRLGELPDDEL